MFLKQEGRYNFLEGRQGFNSMSESKVTGWSWWQAPRRGAEGLLGSWSYNGCLFWKKSFKCPVIIATTMIHNEMYIKFHISNGAWFKHVQTLKSTWHVASGCKWHAMTRNDTQEPAGFRPAGGASCLVNAVGVANVPSLKAPQSNFGVEQSLAEPRMVLV